MPEIIIISKGKEYPCLYDEADRELISQYQWSLHSKGYAQTTIKGKTVLMHRLVMKVTDPKIEVDHRFHNKLDNRKSKLRACNHSENRRNSRKEKNCSSKYKGSYFETERGIYHSQIGFATDNGTKVYNLGRYADERLAGKAYDRKAVELFGRFACVNFQSSKEYQ